MATSNSDCATVRDVAAVKSSKKHYGISLTTFFFQLHGKILGPAIPTDRTHKSLAKSAAAELKPSRSSQIPSGNASTLVIIPTWIGRYPRVPRVPRYCQLSRNNSSPPPWSSLTSMQVCPAPWLSRSLPASLTHAPCSASSTLDIYLAQVRRLPRH